MTFQELGLPPAILEAISDLGFTQPTPIQEQVIPVLLKEEGDIVGLAQTGTGKTAAFGLPAIARTDVSNPAVQVLVLSPTRELCVQITKDIENYSKHVKGLKVTAVYGGAGIEGQVRQLRRGAHIVVGTPGRTLDFIRRGTLDVSNINVLVLDEADEMLKMGFQEDMDAIVDATNPLRQTLLFSATMPAEIQGMAKRYMKSPREISVGNRNTGSSNIEHWFYVCNVKDRYLALKRIADLHPEIYGIIFCKTRKETQEVAELLLEDHYNADALHGDLSQERRDMVMNRFRQGHLQLLVATDVAARGLDVDDLTHVIHFRMPESLDSYIHRSGRTGRAGKKGVSISILGPRDARQVKMLERQVGKTFIQKRIPTSEEIIAKQLFTYIDKVEKTVVDQDKIGPFLDAMYKRLEPMSREELIQHFMSVEFNRFIEYYSDAKDINLGMVDKPGKDKKDRPLKGEGMGVERAPMGDRPARGEREGQPTWRRFFINLGHKHRLNPQRLMGLINDFDSLHGAPIGRIEILNNFSFFEVGGQFAEFVAAELTSVQLGGVSVHVEPAENKEGGDQARAGKVKSFDGPRTEGKDYSSLKKKDKKEKEKKGGFKKDSPFKKDGFKKEGGFKKGKKKELGQPIAVWGDR